MNFIKRQDIFLIKKKIKLLIKLNYKKNEKF
jgi:hypothetical protein